jgi:hypothetical protein
MGQADPGLEADRMTVVKISPRVAETRRRRLRWRRRARQRSSLDMLGLAAVITLLWPTVIVAVVVGAVVITAVRWFGRRMDARTARRVHERREARRSHDAAETRAAR